MKVFQSLNCVLCKEPFARKANEPRSPRSLGCGVVVCNECFENEMPLQVEERKHRCNYEDCFANCVFVFYLIDVLSQEDAVALSSTGDGYVLVKPLKIPECPICHDEYSNQSKEKKSFALYCNHTICTECYLKNRKQNDRDTKNDYQHGFTCPICSRNSCFSGDEWKDQFQDFLDELPELTRQMEGPRNAYVCDECKGTDAIEEMLHCVECNSKACTLCFMEKHTSHEKIKLMEKEAHEMSDALQKDSTSVVKTYEDLFSEMHKGVLENIKDFGKKLVLKENICKDTSKFGDLEQKLEECRKFQEGFETTSEEYMPHLRRYETKIKEFIEEFDKDLN
ncbi:unnamed protein product, partial [Mesorhabditis belari]|uniref:RING-type domain-containing protein n=1 Tax=Mesorhabditis belari TaxID=2138241 RepID=A0AAF3EEK9_9BILA